MRKKETRLKDGKNDCLKIEVNEGHKIEYKFDFKLLKCFVCVGVDLFPFSIKPYATREEMEKDIELSRNA